MSENQEYTNTLGKALNEVSMDEPQVQDNKTILLSTGVVLETRKVTPFVFQTVASQFKYPPIPKTWIEEKSREEYNPQDPEYIAGCEEVDLARATASIDAMIALGTRLVSVPINFEGPETDGWLDDLESIEIRIDRNNERLRYRTWVKYIAAPAVEDVRMIMSKVLRTVGVSEEDVAQAMSNFQRLS